MKPRGRPRVAAPAGASATTWLRGADYDRLIALAKREDKTLSALIRDLLKLKIG